MVDSKHSKLKTRVSAKIWALWLVGYKAIDTEFQLVGNFVAVACSVFHSALAHAFPSVGILCFYCYAIAIAIAYRYRYRLALCKGH